MGQLLNNFSVKLKLFYPIFLGMLLVIFLLAFINIFRSKQLFYQSIEKNLSLEVSTIYKMFERERSMKLDKVNTDMKIAQKIIDDYGIKILNDTFHISIENQNTQNSHIAILNRWTVKSDHQVSLQNVIEQIVGITESTSTIFQRNDSGFVRIATNVRKQNGQNAFATFIPNSSEVVKTILKGKTYIGRAYVVDEWCLTYYKPLYYLDSLVGMIYVGSPEKDLNKLRNLLLGMRIGKSGFIFVFDKNGNVLMSPNERITNVKNEVFFQKIIGKEKGILHYFWNKDSKESMLAYSYYPEFEIYIAASVYKTDETGSSVKNIIQNSLLASALIAILFSVFVLFITTKRLQKLMNALQLSGKRLKNVRVALQRSEENFQTLFDNSSDEIFVTDADANIIEVNKVVCDSLGYSREELLSKKVHDIKSKNFVHLVDINRSETFEKGQFVYESEHITKSGETVQVEIHSRAIEFNGERVIMSISRNIKERKEMERKLLSVVIQTEERERERFSKDMHDGLGPLLSTIKLYVNELDGDEITSEEKSEYLKYLNELIDEAVTNTRTISNNLMPRVIHEYGLVRAVESFCEKLNKTNNLEIVFNTNGIEQNLDQIIQLNLFRIISELINNTLKHAQASKIEINLNKEFGLIILNFKDNGIGFNVDRVMNNKRIGIGLKSIISRVKAINGNYKFNSAINEGFEIEIKI